MLTLPARPDGLVDEDLCAVSGMAAGPHCPHIHDYAIAGRPAPQPCDWHDDHGVVHYPHAAGGWLARAKH